MIAILPFLTVLATLSIPQQVDTLLPCIDGEQARVTGRYAEAIRHYTTCLAESVLTRENLATAHVNRGLARAALGDTAGAVADYDTAIATLPDAPEAYVNRGLARAAEGALDDAEDDYGQALLRSPELPQAFVDRGLVYAARGETAAAIADYERALAVDPDLTAALYNRGTAHYLAGDYALARDDYGLTLGRNPRHAKARFGRGAVAFVEAEWLTASRDLRRSLELDPEQPYAALLAFVAEAELGLSPDRALLEPYADGDTWPAPAAALLLGRITPEAALAAAGDDPQRRCEAAFYAAAYHRMRGEATEALEMLEATVATGITRYVEYRSAVRALREVGE